MQRRVKVTTPTGVLDVDLVVAELFPWFVEVHGRVCAATYFASMRAEVDERLWDAVFTITVDTEQAEEWLHLHRAHVERLLHELTGRPLLLAVHQRGHEESDLVYRARAARERWRDVHPPRWNPPDRRVDYHTYIASDAWAEFRLAVLEAYSYQCAHCGAVGVPLQVHHFHYVTLGWEDFDDVVALCVPCHEVADARRKEDSRWRVQQTRASV